MQNIDEIRIDDYAEYNKKYLRKVTSLYFWKLTLLFSASKSVFLYKYYILKNFESKLFS